MLKACLENVLEIQTIHLKYIGQCTFSVVKCTSFLILHISSYHDKRIFSRMWYLLFRTCFNLAVKQSLNEEDVNYARLFIGNFGQI